METPTVINEQTKIPLSLTRVIIVAACGGAFWLTSMFFEVKANSKEIESLKIDQKEEVRILQDIHARVIRIEEQIKK